MNGHIWSWVMWVFRVTLIDASVRIEAETQHYGWQLQLTPWEFGFVLLSSSPYTRDPFMPMRYSSGMYALQ